jgi:predicted PurR-regulated permease PerM
MIDALRQLPSWLRLSVLFPLFCLNFWLLSLLIEYCQPFVDFLIIATLIAFFLELLIKGLQKWKVSRGLAIAVVLLGTLIISILIGFIIVPTMINELGEFIENAPQWIRQGSQKFNDLSTTPLAQKYSLNLDTIVAEGSKRLASAIKSVGGQAINIALETIASLVNVLIIAILTIFLVIGGETFWDGIFSWFPPPWNDKIRDYTFKRFKDYFFSRAILALIASIIRGVIFAVFAIPYPFLFAFGLGITSLIPFLSGVIISLTAILLCLNSIALGLKFFVSAIIIDFVTDNVAAPRLMGELIGLNPLWILIALFIGGKLGGLLGLFLAVPLASVIKQIIDDLREQPQLTENEPDII